jgi:hypothetical protein
MKRLFAVAAVVLLSVSAFAQTTSSYSTGFEDFNLGAMSTGLNGSTQGGWSGGQYSGYVASDLIVNTVAHTGGKSWLCAGTVTSAPGPGTPFTPNLATAVTNVGDVFQGSLWFKAHTAADGSRLEIDAGNTAGDNRSEILAFVQANAGGLTVNTFDYPDGAGVDNYSSVIVADGLDAGIWHQLSYSFTRTATGNALSVSVDNGQATVVSGYIAEYFDEMIPPQPYCDSSRMKFRSRDSLSGFYLDDISYSVTSASVPEPSSVLALLGGLGSLLAFRRRRA